MLCLKYASTNSHMVPRRLSRSGKDLRYWSSALLSLIVKSLRRLPSMSNGSCWSIQWDNDQNLHTLHRIMTHRGTYIPVLLISSFWLIQRTVFSTETKYVPTCSALWPIKNSNRSIQKEWNAWLETTYFSVCIPYGITNVFYCTCLVL